MKIVTDKRIPLRATRAAAGQSRVQPSVSSKTPALRSSKTPALKSTKTPAPKSSTRTPAVKSSTTAGKSKKENLIKAGATPKQTGKSFAPKNFQFSQTIPIPSAPAQKRTASRATKINAGRGIIDDENTNDENRNVNIGAATTGRLSRRDRLEQYRKDKKAAIERMLYPSDAERFTTLLTVWLPCPPFQTQKTTKLRFA